MKNMIKGAFNYIIRKKKKILTSKFLSFVENLLHSTNLYNKIYMRYFLVELSSFF